MFTILMTVFGLFVFIISLATAGFKTAFKRLLMLAATGVILDTITWFLIGTVVFTFA